MVSAMPTGMASAVRFQGMSSSHATPARGYRFDDIVNIGQRLNVIELDGLDDEIDRRDALAAGP